MSDRLPNEYRYGKISRRQMLRLMGGAGAGVLLAACGGNQIANTTTTQPNSASTQSGAKTIEGGENATTPTLLPSGGSVTNSGASPASTYSTAKAAIPASDSTQAPVPTVSAQNFKESPELTKMVKSGKLPKVSDRLPKNPMVLEPVEKIGSYGGTWHLAYPYPYRYIAYEHLVRWKPGTKNFTVEDVIPGIAESFEANDEGTEYTFKLRGGMKWSDGKPFTADDIMFWYKDYLLNKELTPTAPDWLSAGGKPVTVERRDDYTVTFKFSGPNGLFLQNLATPSGDQITLYPAHYLKQFHKKYNPKVEQQADKANMQDWTKLFAQKADWQSNGDKPVLFAWKLKHAIGESTQQIVAERNPYYWKVDTEGNQLPYLDQVVFTVTQTQVQVEVLKALNGEVDMQYYDINSFTNKPLFYRNQKKGNYHFFKTLPASMNTIVISLNLTHKDPVKRKVFQNKDFRIGMSYAINRLEIIDVGFQGQGKPWQAAPRAESPLYNEKLARQYTEHDVKKANEHLDKVLPKKDSQGMRLGPDGKRFSFTAETAPASHFNPQPDDTLSLIQRHLKEVGVDMRYKIESSDLWSTRYTGNEPDCSTWDGDGGLEVLIDPRWYFPWGLGSFFAVPWAFWYNLGGLDHKLSDEELKSAGVRWKSPQRLQRSRCASTTRSRLQPIRINRSS